MNILLFATSLRAASLNKKLIKVAASLASQVPGVQVEVVDLKSFSIPLYDGDIEDAGMPVGVTELGKKVAAANALILSTPEYNGSIASPTKNTLDWLSRLSPVPLEGKPILLLGASPGALGAMRGLIHARNPFDVLGTHLYHLPFGLPRAHEAFTDEGDLKDAATKKRLNDLIGKFVIYAKRFPRE